MLKFSVTLISTFVLSVSLLAQSEFQVFVDKNGRVHIRTRDGGEQVVPGEPHQRGIESVQTAPDGQTVGWLVDYSDPDNSSPDAGKLVIFRGGRIVRRFDSDQVFGSWTFYAQEAQVAYHVGPIHGEESSHCELRDVKTGRLLAQWNGDLDDTKRPQWAKGLDH